MNINPPRTPAPVPMALPAEPYFACSVVPANGFASIYAATILTTAFASCSMICDIDVGTIVLYACRYPLNIARKPDINIVGASILRLKTAFGWSLTNHSAPKYVISAATAPAMTTYINVQ